MQACIDEPWRFGLPTDHKFNFITCFKIISERGCPKSNFGAVQKRQPLYLLTTHGVAYNFFADSTISMTSGKSIPSSFSFSTVGILFLSQPRRL